MHARQRRAQALRASLLLSVELPEGKREPSERFLTADVSNGEKHSATWAWQRVRTMLLPLLWRRSSFICTLLYVRKGPWKLT
jgi:hypothetical protein